MAPNKSVLLAPTNRLKMRFFKMEKCNFLKILILKICGVIADTYPSLKSLTKVMEDFF